MTRTPARRAEIWGEMGPAMRALPNAAWRTFVFEFVSNPNPNTGGGKAAAYCAAGFGLGSDATQQAKDAWKLAHDDRIIAAISEEARKVGRTTARSTTRAPAWPSRTSISSSTPT
jgi:hypothetical protein